MGTKKYTKTAWVNGSAPAVSATNLLNIENGIEGANGIDVLKNITTGLYNTGVGDYALDAVTTANHNTAHGYLALSAITSSGNNTAIGSLSLSVATGASNTGLGYATLSSCTTGTNNVAIGHNSSANLTTGNYNIAIGRSSLFNANTGDYNSVIGYGSCLNLNGANSVVSIGYESQYNNTTASNTVSLGALSLRSLTTGSNNTAIGYNALYTTTASTSSTAVGYNSLDVQTTGYLNTAIGFESLGTLATFYNCTGLGANTAVTGNNQVQLGDAATTTYAYGAVQNRSDERDKTDIKDTEIGLKFITQLRPVDYRWNYREDYKEIITVENEDGTSEKQTIIHDNNGSKKRTRFHHGLIAQEVKQVADSLGIDFGGYQDHKIAGGEDVLSIGYTELIAPMIKAIQELNAKIELLESKLGGA